MSKRGTITVPARYRSGITEEAYRAGYESGYRSGMVCRSLADAKQVATAELATALVSLIPDGTKQTIKKAGRKVAKRIKEAGRFQQFAERIADVFDDRKDGRR